MLTTTVAGRTWSFSHAIGRNTAAGNGFNQPMSVAVAPDGILYVLSRGNELGLGGIRSDNRRIGKLTIDEEFIGDFGRGGELTWPAGLAIDQDGNVYCSDEYENVIAIYNSEGERLGQWGETGSQEGQLNAPSGIGFDSDDNLYVVDSGNDRVQKFTKEGQFLSVWGNSGDGDGQFNRPWGMTVDRQGNILVADWGNSRIQKFAPDGSFLLSFGNQHTDGQDLDHPANVAVDSEGDIYVTDWGNLRVQIYDPDYEILTTLWGDAHVFSKWAQVAIDSNPDAVKAYRRVTDTSQMARFQRPVGIAIDEQDRIIITENTRQRLQIYVKEKDYMDPQFNL